MGKPIPIRLTDEKWAYYSEQAQAAGIGLSTYLKRRLERGDQVAEQLAELRRVIAEGFGELREGSDSAPRLDSSAGQNPGLLIEAILLLRSVVGQDKLGVVHGELKRQGLPIWTGEKGAKK